MRCTTREKAMPPIGTPFSLLSASPTRTNSHNSGFCTEPTNTALLPTVLSILV